MAVRRRRWTLRRRLVLGIVGLLAVLSVIVGTVSVLALQGSLMSKLDSQVKDSVQRLQDFDSNRPSPGGSNAGGGLFGAGLGPGGVSAVIVDGVLTGRVVGSSLSTGGSTSENPPQLTSKPLTAAEASPINGLGTDGEPVTLTLGDLGAYRVAAVSLQSGAVVVVGLPLSEVTSTVMQVIAVVIIAVIAAIAVAVLAGLWVVRSALRPLERVTATASHVSELPLDRGEVAIEARVPEEDADPRTEVGQVGAAINRMLGHVAAALTARESSEKKLRSFVADASHELRTPLASIRGYAELTRRGDYELPDDVVHALGRVESESVRMTSLVEDLLLLARLDDGRELESNPVDLTRLLADAVSDAHAAGPDHEWALEVPDEPIVVPGDAARLHQVVVNLLGNARVHTPAGTHVVASALRVGDTVEIRVTDDGPGIPETVLPTVFERFARGDSSRSRVAGSTGLGLAIVAAVVDAHGGTVGVESEPGRTVFTVTLPA